MRVKTDCRFAIGDWRLAIAIGDLRLPIQIADSDSDSEPGFILQIPVAD